MNNLLMLICLWAFIPFSGMAQSDQMETTMDNVLPYREIPDAPESYTETSVVARMIDGLGFRFYWATEGLRPEDLAYRPTPESRSAEETIDHIYGLTNMLTNCLKGQANVKSGEETSALPYEEKRSRILKSLHEASQQMRSGAVALDSLQITFQRGDSQSHFPFWNMINGPLSDALWHVGQLVSFRRASGNPIDPKASVFTGTVRE